MENEYGIDENEYRLEQGTGKLFTWNEYVDEYFFVMPDSGIIANSWGNMPVIEIPEGKLEEMRKKLELIYKPDRWSHTFGTHAFVKDPTKLLKLKPNPCK